MEKKRKMPPWVLDHKKKGTQITQIKNGYYLYKIKSIWDKDKQRAKKITEEYLGKITKDGLIPPKHKRDLKLESTKEYGNILFVKENNEQLIQKLKKYFPYDYQSIICIAIIKLCYLSRIKNMSLRYQTSYLSEFFKEAKISENKVSDLISLLGNNTQKINQFFESIKKEGETIAIDLTTIFTDSENISFAEKGYNSKKIYHDQLQFLMIYSLKQSLPTYFKVLPGSIRDVSSLVNAIKESEYEDVILVSDRGFTSESNWEFLASKKLKYIFPLRKNSNLISYKPLEHKDYFMFRKRVIWNRGFESGGKKIIQFLDKKLMVEEEKTFLSLVEKNLKTIKDYHEKKDSFGIISIITNTNYAPKKIFETYKSRNDIEVAFNTLKNSLDDDKTYMQSTEKIRGYFFLTFLALHMYIKMQNILREKDLLKKQSVLDVLLQLSKIYKIKVQDKELISEIPKQVKKIVEKLELPIT